jgi:hypothetical protein
LPTATLTTAALSAAATMLLANFPRFTLSWRWRR